MSDKNNPSSNGGPMHDYSKGRAASAAGNPYLTRSADGTSRGGESRQGISVSFVLNVARRWWKLATPIGLALAAGIALLIYIRFKPEYEASALIEIKAARPYVAYPSGGNSGASVRTELASIRSPLVIGPVVSRPEIAKLDQIRSQQDPVRWLMGKIQAGSLEGSELYMISYTGPKEEGLSGPFGQAAAQIVNAVVEEYMNLWRGETDKDTQQLIELLKREQSYSEDEVTALRDIYANLYEKATGTNPYARGPNIAPVAAPTLSQLEVLLARARAQKKYADNKVKVFEEAFDKDFDLGLKATTSDTGEVTVTLKGANNDFQVAATERQTAFGQVEITFVHKNAVGNKAIVTFDALAKALTIDVDPTATTAQTVIDEINEEGAFEASLVKPDGAEASGNDGTGPVCRVRVEDFDPRKAEATGDYVEVRQLRALEITLAAKEKARQDFEKKVVDIEKVKDESHPLYGRYRGLLEDIADEQARLEDVRTRLMFKVRKDRLALAQEELVSSSTAEAVYLAHCEEERKKDRKARGETAEVEFAGRDLALAEEVHNIIEKRIKAEETELSAPARVKLRQPAQASNRPVRSLPMPKIILGVLAGLCLPFGLAVGWEFLIQRVSDAQQLEQRAQLPVVAEVSRLPIRARVSSRASSRRIGRDVRLFEESIDSLRTYLTLSESLKDMKVLAVTSAANNEGKTSVAVQLAVSSARASGELALLVDGDMRSPDIHKVLDTALQPGLAEVLSGNCTVEDAIITNWSKHVHLLPAGKLRGSPHKLVGDGALKSLLDEVRSTYRYVIIDTPPVLAASEALVFAKAADASLICTMRDISRVDQVNATHERLFAANANPIGIVLNGVPTKQYAYRYGSYHYTLSPDSNGNDTDA